MKPKVDKITANPMIIIVYESQSRRDHRESHSVYNPDFFTRLILHGNAYKQDRHRQVTWDARPPTQKENPQ